MQNRYLLPEWAAPDHVKSFTSLRAVGDYSAASQGKFSAFNLAYHCGDDVTSVQKNRTLLQADWQWKQPPLWLHQVHGRCVVPAHETRLDNLPEADASWTNQPETPCVVLTADCLPVLLCNRHGTKVAAAHAGWRGLASGIIEQTVSTLNEKPEDLLVWLGPAISQSFFEVGPEVRSAFTQSQPETEAAFTSGKDDRWQADIYQLARLCLQRLGIHAIYGGEFCTFRESSQFYSYRREKNTGRMVTAIWIQSPL